MPDLAKWILAATMGASALACIGVSAAAAADVQVPYGEPRYTQPRQAPPPEYYPPDEERYGYRQAPRTYREAPPAYREAPPAYREAPPAYREAPPAYREAPPAYVYREAPPPYVYPAPPPPAYRYYEEPLEFDVVPPRFYGPRHYGYQWHGPRIAREYGPYGRPWGYRKW